jgi:hypothetical protein
MHPSRWPFYLIAASVLPACACAPALRDQDVTALTHVQGDLARRYADSSTPGPDKLMFKVEYCEIDTVVVAAGKTGAGKVPCQ